MPPRFTNAASSVCEGEYGCTVIAGDFEDSPDVARYEDEYIGNLDPVPLELGSAPVLLDRTGKRSAV